MPRESHVPFTVLSVCLAGLAGCSSGSSGGSTIIVDPPELAIVDVRPGDGTQGVDPTAAITVTFSLPVDEIPAAAWTVQDGPVAVAGLMEPSVDGLRWTWRPQEEWTRGAQIQFRLASGIRSRDGVRLPTELVGGFSVREVVTEATFSAPLGPSKVMVWPNGRRAVTTGSRCHEVVFGQLVERPFLFKPDDVPYGDGSFLSLVGAPGATPLSIARRNLDGSEQLVGLPAPQIRLASVNTNGDAVFAYRQPVLTSTPWQLFRLMASSQAFEWLGATNAIDTSRFEPVIGEDGTIYVGYRDATTAQPTMLKIAPNSTTPELFVADETLGVGDVLCGVAADGVATLLWMSGTDGLRAATLAPGGALEDLAERLELNGPQGDISLTFDVARSGTAAVQIRTNVGFVNLDDFVRLERTGWVGFPIRYGNTDPIGNPPQTRFHPETGEWWVVRGGGALGTLERLRSRPGDPLGEPAQIYASALTGQIISTLEYDFDAYGRVVLALTEFYPSSQGLVVLLE